MNTPHLHLPDAAVEVPDSDPVEYRLGPLRIEVRRHSDTLDVVLHNTSGNEVEAPGLPLRWEKDCPVAWLSGGTGMVLAPDGRSMWRMLSGWCSDTGQRDEGPTALLFGEVTRLAAGQRAWSRWRCEDVTAGITLPGWVPSRRHLPTGEALEITDLDVALSGDGLSFETTSTASLVRGTPGLHQLTVHGPGGATTLEVGWFPSVSELVATALTQDPDAGVAAWLMSWLLTDPVRAKDERLLDRLDVTLGALEEAPTLFGVLAALRVTATTELPLREVALRMTRDLLTTHPGHSDAVFIAVAALLTGCPEAVADLAPPRVTMTGDDLLRTLEHGLPSSVGPTCTARDVAWARLWSVSRPDSIDHLAVTEATALAQARLMCRLAQAMDPTEVAWLLLCEAMT